MKKIILSFIIIACLLSGCNNNNEEIYCNDVFKAEIDTKLEEITESAVESATNAAGELFE